MKFFKQMKLAICAGVVMSSPYANAEGLVGQSKQSLSPNCLVYSISEKFDYSQQPLWLNLGLNRDESRFKLGSVGKAVMGYFASEMNARGKQVTLVAFPDTAQFMPDRETHHGALINRFSGLYEGLNREMETLGYVPIDVRFIADRNQETFDLHRNLDHHLTSKGRYVLAAQIAERLGELETFPGFEALASQYEEFETEQFAVWKPSARNFAIDQCKDELDQLPFDETVELPMPNTSASLDSSSLFGDAPAARRVALAGTSQSLSADGNLGDMISRFSGLEVDNFSKAGGGASMALQVAASEGALDTPAYDHLIWEVFTDYDEARLTGAAIAALGMSNGQCQMASDFASGEPEKIRFGKWHALENVSADSGSVIALPNTDHTKGRLSVRFTFQDSRSLTSEIWRWAADADPATLGDWKFLVPDFEGLGQEKLQSVSIKLDGLYEYDPKGEIEMKPSVCNSGL